MEPHATRPPASMRAVVIDRLGGPEELQVRTLPVPRPGSGEVLVRVEAIGINPIDWLTRGGSGVAVGSFPAVLGWDLSGTVVGARGGVSRFAPGDQVFGLARFPALGEAYAEYAAVPEADLAFRPAAIDPLVAAAAPMAALTAWQALYQLVELTAGQRVLIHGAAGGVGHIAVQLAKLRGAEVLATASPRNHELVTALGADRTIDYRSDWIGTAARDLDVIVDPLGGPGFFELLRALRPGGTIVTLKGRDPAHEAATRDGYRVAYAYVGPDGATLGQIAELLAGGRLRVHVERTFELASVGEAHALGERGGVRGKLVARVGGSSPSA